MEYADSRHQRHDANDTSCDAVEWLMRSAVSLWL